MEAEGSFGGRVRTTLPYHIHNKRRGSIESLLHYLDYMIICDKYYQESDYISSHSRSLTAGSFVPSVSGPPYPAPVAPPLIPTITGFSSTTLSVVCGTIYVFIIIFFV